MDDSDKKLPEKLLKVMNQLYYAISYRDLPRVRAIVNQGLDVNQLYCKQSISLMVPRNEWIRPPKEWFSALHLAIDIGWLVGVQYLVEAGANINLQNHCIQEGVYNNNQKVDLAPTPLMRAISLWPKENRMEQIVEFLLEKGADPNLRCPHTKHSAITTALQYSSRPAVACLLKEGSIDLDVTVYTSDGTKTVLELACKDITEESVHRAHQLLAIPELQSFTELIIHGADVNASFVPLRHLVSLKSFDQEVLNILNLMYHNGVNVDMVTYDSFFSYGPTALCEVVNNSGHLNYIRWLLRHGANSSRIGLGRFFTKALYLKEYNIAEVLLHSGLTTHHANRIVVEHIHLTKSAYGAPWAKGSQDDDYDEELCLEYLTEIESKHSSLKEQQEADLLEFSRESLEIYEDFPKDEEAQVSRLYNILCQPPSLQHHCRVLIRQRLVSNAPSTVKTLPIPYSLKQYVLCHDV